MRYYIVIISLVCSLSLKAQYLFTETFDSNSLEWTEFENQDGSAIINNGFLVIKSNGENKVLGGILTGLSGVYTQVGENTFFETHCYAPIDVQVPFRIIADVQIEKLDMDRQVGFVFNYKDAGNFYSFTFNEEMVYFSRWENNMCVGHISQGIRWPKKKKTRQKWELESDGQTLKFTISGIPILKVRYMPLTYSGVGFFTYGKQTLIVDDVEFVEL